MNKRIVIVFLLMFFVPVAMGVYSPYQSKAEIPYLMCPVPAGNITSPVTVKGAGLSVTTRAVVYDIDGVHLLKKLFNPNVVRIAVYISNVGEKPINAIIELVNCTMTVGWWINPTTPSNKEGIMPGQLRGPPYVWEWSSISSSPIMPGQKLPESFLFFEIPPSLMDKPVIYHGGLKITDVDTGEFLTFIPIEIVRGGLMQA